MMRLAALLVVALASVTPTLADFDALLTYARTEDFAGVRAELAAATDPNPPQYHHGYSPLQFAAGNGDAEMTRLLLEAGADTECRDHNGDRAMIWAAERGHAAAVKLLLDAGSPADSDDPYGDSPLMDAARYGHREVVRLLLAAGADPNQRGQSSDTPLHSAALGGDPALVEMLLAAGANPNVIDEILLETPLHVAAAYGDAAIIAALVAAGAALDARQQDGETPLFVAAKIGLGANVRALIEAGADPDATDLVGRTPLIAGIASFSEQPTRDLAVTSLAVVTRDLDRAFVAALRNGFIPQALTLLERGASANALDEDGRSALANSARQPGLTMFQLLINRGADIERFGAEALLAAAEQGHALIARALLERGIGVDVRDPRGATPLLLAAKNAHVATVELLLDAGAERIALDAFGLDADDYMEIVPGFFEVLIEQRQASRAWRPTEHIEIDLAAMRERQAQIRALLAAAE